ncbi:hypothetical protein B0H14DRAFT_3630203 [Mycena olivaceomarginata]|nr:hypothetical protein B0H14DRAFT_3630203 [Mycena olivaceomarginata]
MAKYLVHLSFTSTNTILAPSFNITTLQSLEPTALASTGTSQPAPQSLWASTPTVTSKPPGTPLQLSIPPRHVLIETDQVTFSLPAGTKCAGGKAKNLCLVSVKTTGGFGACTVVSQGNAAAANPHSKLLPLLPPSPGQPHQNPPLTPMQQHIWAHHMCSMNAGAEDSTVLLWLCAVTKCMNTLFSKQLEDRAPLQIKKGETWLQTVKGSVPLNNFLLYNLFSNLVHTFIQVAVLLARPAIRIDFDGWDTDIVFTEARRLVGSSAGRASDFTPSPRVVPILIPRCSPSNLASSY